MTWRPVGRRRWTRLEPASRRWFQASCPKPARRLRSCRQRPGFTSVGRASFLAPPPWRPSARTVCQDPASAPVRPSQTFEIFKCSREPREGGGKKPALFGLGIRNSDFFRISAFGLRISPASAPVRPLKFLKNTRHDPFLHFSFFIFHSKTGGFKVIQGCSKLNFFSGRRGPKWGPLQGEFVPIRPHSCPSFVCWNCGRELGIPFRWQPMTWVRPPELVSAGQPGSCP